MVGLDGGWCLVDPTLCFGGLNTLLNTSEGVCGNHAQAPKADPPLAHRGELAPRGCAHVVGLHVADDSDAAPGGAGVGCVSATATTVLPAGRQHRRGAGSGQRPRAAVSPPLQDTDPRNPPRCRGADGQAPGGPQPRFADEVRALSALAWRAGPSTDRRRVCRPDARPLGWAGPGG